MCYKKQKHGRRSCKGFTHDLKLRLYKNKMSSPPGHGVLGAWKEGAGCPEGFPPQAGPRPPADACFTRPAAPSETGFLRPRDRQTRSRVGRWRQPHTTPGKAKPCGSTRPPGWNGKGKRPGHLPPDGRPGTGAGECRRGGGGEGPNDLAEAGSGSERAPAPTSVHSPRGRLPGLCEFMGSTGAPGPPLDVRQSQAQGVRGRHWGYQGQGGGLAGGRECHPGQRGGRCRRRGTRPS